MNGEKIDMSESMRKGIYILPNLFTTGSLFAGFYSMVSTMNSDYKTAAIWVLVSSIFDGLDGKVARLTGKKGPLPGLSDQWPAKNMTKSPGVKAPAKAPEGH